MGIQEVSAFRGIQEVSARRLGKEIIIPPEALPASDTISSPKSDMPASEPFVAGDQREHATLIC